MMAKRKIAGSVALLVSLMSIAILLSACGQTGPLVLPSQSAPAESVESSDVVDETLESDEDDSER